ncbi:hypothetical protein [Alteriqipengyuania lutimaris]|uniref:hypothetical protein n=1 Tax=Alteriqipengyuania lutimaris TaxID=1538146 RepID=UPI0015F1A09C|nr:hypothetical protein [Alteriqipengyuania lutimaris]MBB3032787.1 hypothetical protein [Alteriqipengyuania lutimaris]
MDGAVKKGFPFVGICFLVLAVIKFLQGDDWVVWAILGFLFGGFGVFGARSKKESEQ